MTAGTSRGLQPISEVLSNGTRITVVRSPATPAVTISASLQAGSVYDPDGKPGLAHFLSRVLDRGSTQCTGQVIAEQFDLRGVSLQVSVTRHTLALSCDCLAEDFEAVMSLIAGIIRNPTFPNEEIGSRRGEILTAIGQDDDNPAVMAVSRLMPLLYGSSHPYGHSSKGTSESVRRIKRDAIQGFHRERVGSTGLSVVVVGDVDPKSAIAVTSQGFGDWSSQRQLDLILESPESVTSRRQVVIPMMNKSQVDIAYGFTTIPRSDPTYYTYWLLANILGQYGLGGRLGRRIREQQGMAYYAFCGLEASVIAGPLMVRAGVNTSNVDRAVEAIDAEMATFVADGVTEAELSDSKRYLIGSLPRTLETNAGIAAFLQNTEQFMLGLDFDLRLPGLLDQVTRDDVNGAACQTLVPERAALAIAGPYQD